MATDINSPTLKIAPYWGWTTYTPVIPKLYWDVYSQEERIKRMCREYDKLAHYASVIAEQTNMNTEEIEALQALFKKFQESGFDDYYKKQIEEWINKNLESILHLLVRQVYFGINEQGYFVAYIPDSWNDIQFDTGAVYSEDTYGRLILRWDADSPYTVNQEAEIVR